MTGGALGQDRDDGSVSVHGLARRVPSDGAGASPPAPGTASPSARRAARPSWRDPRLAIGVVLVAASALVGGRLLASADDRVEVWSAAVDLPVGAPITEADLTTVPLRSAGGDLLERYLPAAATPPTGSVLLRPVGAGELVPRGALGAEAPEDRVEVPVAVAPESIAATVGAGAVVDVWVTPGSSGSTSSGNPAGTAAAPGARLVFDDVVVVEAGRPESGLGPASVRRIVVAVPPGDEALADDLAQLGAGSAVVVRQR